MEKQSNCKLADNVQLTTLGESAIVLEYTGIDALSAREKLELQQRLLAFSAHCRQTSQNAEGNLIATDSSRMIELINAIPGNLNVTLRFDPLKVTPDDVQIWATSLWRKDYLSSHSDNNLASVVTLPVHYGSHYGPDLDVVANTHGLTPEAVIHQHSGASYSVLFNGFLPGFPYLSGLPETLHTRRRATPRLHVAKGSVAIGGSQAGIYPCESPGGWQIIGRLAEHAPELFDAAKPALLLPAGSTVRFEPV